MDIIGIDPADTRSAYVIMNTDTWNIRAIDKVNNDELLAILKVEAGKENTQLAIEDMKAWGVVDNHVTRTLIAIGRFYQQWCVYKGSEPVLYPRKTVVTSLTGMPTKGDKHVRAKVIDRFEDFYGVTLPRGKQTKESPLYGASGDGSDKFQAVGVALHWIDSHRLDVLLS